MNAQLSLLSDCPCGRPGCQLPEAPFNAGDVMRRWLEGQGLSLAEVNEAGNQVEFVEVRRLMAVYLREHGWSWPRIGKFLERDHSAVMNLVKPRSRRISVVACS